MSQIPSLGLFSQSQEESSHLTQEDKIQRVVITAWDLFYLSCQKLKQPSEQTFQTLLNTLPEEEHLQCLECLLLNLPNTLNISELNPFEAVALYHLLVKEPLVRALLKTETFASRFFNQLCERAASPEANPRNINQALNILDALWTDVLPSLESVRQQLAKLLQNPASDFNNLALLEILLIKTPAEYLRAIPLEDLFQSALDLLTLSKPYEELPEKHFTILKHLLARENLSEQFLARNFGPNITDLIDLGDLGCHVRMLTEATLYQKI